MQNLCRFAFPISGSILQELRILTQDQFIRRHCKTNPCLGAVCYSAQDQFLLGRRALRCQDQSLLGCRQLRCDAQAGIGLGGKFLNDSLRNRKHTNAFCTSFIKVTIKSYWKCLQGVLSSLFCFHFFFVWVLSQVLCLYWLVWNGLNSAKLRKIWNS